MKKLISLEQYVDDQSLKFASDNYKSLDVLCEIFQYTNTLKQQPKLNHFIPCVEKDGKWEILEKPKKEDYLVEKEYQNEKGNIVDIHKYEKAKQKHEIVFESATKNVLFDGWELKYQSDAFIGIEGNGYGLEFNVSNGKLSNDLTYSDLTPLNLPLTDNGEIYFNLKK